MEYSPWALEIEKEGLLKTARELGVAIVSYSPIGQYPWSLTSVTPSLINCTGRGMLTGAIRSPDDFEDGDFRKFAPRFSKENFPKNLKLVDEINAIAKKKGCTASQLTLAWLLAQGDDIFPIPGTTKIDRLEENLGALKIHLSEEEKAEIRKISESAEIAGGRYPEAFAKANFADTPELN